MIEAVIVMSGADRGKLEETLAPDRQRERADRRSAAIQLGAV